MARTTGTVIVDDRVRRGVPLPSTTPSWNVHAWTPSPNWMVDADRLEAQIPTGPVLFHTTVPIAQRVQQAPQRWPKLAAGLSFPLHMLDAHVQNGRLGALALNRDALYAPFGQLARLEGTLASAFGPSLFLRPNSPTKPFAGRPIPAGEWALELNSIRALERPGDDLLCMIAPHQTIAQPEWRFWCVDGEPIAHAPYAFAAGPWPGLTPEPALIDTARKGAQRLLEGDGLLVVDVCMDGQGTARVVEANAWSTSGFYPGMDPTTLWEAARDVWI